MSFENSRFKLTRSYRRCYILPGIGQAYLSVWLTTHLPYQD